MRAGVRIICAVGLWAGLGVVASGAGAGAVDAAALKAMVESHAASAAKQVKEAETLHAEAKAAFETAGKRKDEAVAKLEQALLVKEAEHLAAARATYESAEKRYALVYAELYRQQPQKIEADKKFAEAEAAHLKEDKDPVYDAEFDAAFDRYLEGRAKNIKANNGNAGLLKSYFPFYASEKRKRATVVPEARKEAITQAVDASEKKKAELALRSKAKNEKWTALHTQYQKSLAEYKAAVKTPALTATFTAEQDRYYDFMRQAMREEWGDEGFLKNHIYPLQLIYRDRLAGLKGAKHKALEKATQALEAENKELRTRIAEANKAWTECAAAYKDAQRRYFLAPRVAAAEQRMAVATRAHEVAMKQYAPFMERSKAEGAKIEKARADFFAAQQACAQSIELSLTALRDEAQKCADEFARAGAAYEAAVERLAASRQEQARLGNFAKVCARGAKTPESAAALEHVLKAVTKLQEVQALRQTRPSLLAPLEQEKNLTAAHYAVLREKYDPALAILRAKEQFDGAKSAYKTAPRADAGLEKRYQSLVEAHATAKHRLDAANTALKETGAALDKAAATLSREEKDYLLTKDFKPVNPQYLQAKSKSEQAQRLNEAAQRAQKEAQMTFNSVNQDCSDIKASYGSAKRTEASEADFADAEKRFAAEIEKANKAMPAFLAAKQTMTAARERYALKATLHDYLIALKLRVVDMNGKLAEKAVAGSSAKKAKPAPGKNNKAVAVGSPESEEDRLEASAGRTMAIAEMIARAIEGNPAVLDGIAEAQRLEEGKALLQQDYFRHTQTTGGSEALLKSYYPAVLTEVNQLLANAESNDRDVIRSRICLVEQDQERLQSETLKRKNAWTEIHQHYAESVAAYGKSLKDEACKVKLAAAENEYVKALHEYYQEVSGDAGVLQHYYPFHLKLLRARMARTGENDRADLQQQIQRIEKESQALRVSHAEVVKTWTAKKDRQQAALAGFKDAVGNALDEAYRRALKEEGGLSPRVRYAFMAMRQYEAVLELHNAGIHLPDELLSWVDYRGVVGSTLYGMRFGRPAVCLARLRSLELDFGREQLQDYIQPALGLIYAPRSGSLASLKKETRPGQFSLRDRPKFNLVIPGRPTPWAQTVPAMNVHHHVINFLENEETPGRDGIITETRRERMLTAHQAYSDDNLRTQFVNYMERHGHEVGDVYECLRAAYVQTGRRQAKTDPMPSDIEWFAFHLKYTPSIKTYPWPFSYFSLKNKIPMREALAITHKGRETEKYVGGGRYAVNNPLLPYDIGGASLFWHQGQYGVCWRSNIMNTRIRAAQGLEAFKSYSTMHVDTVYFIPHGGGIYSYLQHGSKSNISWPYGAVFGDPGESLSPENKGKMTSLAHAVGYGITEYSYSHLAWLMADLLPKELKDKYYLRFLSDGLSWNPHNYSLLRQAAGSVKTKEDVELLAKGLKIAQERANGKKGVLGSPASLPRYKSLMKK